MELENPSFEKYANFSDKKAILPIQDYEALSDNERPVHQGAFTSVIEIDEGKVVKVNRLLRYSPQKENPVEFGAYEDPDFLAEKVEDPSKSADELEELNRQQATEKIIKFAEYKRGIYEQLGKYIPGHLPEIYGFAVVDSPRREIEQRLKRGKLTPEQEREIPTQETALMEVWENVSPEASLNARGYEGLSELQEDSTYREQMRSFANGLLSLAREQGIMVDICDYGGINAVRSNGEHLNIKKPEDIVQLLSSQDTEILAYPRNTVYKDGEVKFFDTYPIENITEFTQDGEFLTAVVKALSEGNYQELVNLAGAQDSRDGVNRRQVIQYLSLLKYMGADFEN